MALNEYHFITQWRVQAGLDEINAVLGDAQGLVRWWPSVYLDARQLADGDATGVGRIISLYTKGWLPYTLKWQFQITENRSPAGFTLTAWGDFVGRGIWSFEPAGDEVRVTYDWKILAEKPILRYLSFLMKPIFGANHRWAMERGRQSLLLELARRRAGSDAARAAVGPPPGPTFARLIRPDVAPPFLLPGAPGTAPADRA